jgi:hypothetical protein
MKARAPETGIRRSWVWAHAQKGKNEEKREGLLWSYPPHHDAKAHAGKAGSEALVRHR